VNISAKIIKAVTTVIAAPVTQKLAIIVNCENARLMENALNTVM
jgi:hypothetical protein